MPRRVLHGVRLPENCAFRRTHCAFDCTTRTPRDNHFGGMMKPCEALLLIATALAASVPSVCAQPRGHWSAFKKADGLAESACVSVTIGAGGNVLVRHLKSNAVSALDGYEISSIPAPGPNHHRVYESPGGQLWTVAAEGLQEFRDGEWVLHRVPGSGILS